MKNSKNNKWVKPLCIAAIVIFTITAIWAIYIMKNNIGSVDGVDFGPGQYYYTDIPNWKDYFLVDRYHSKTPMSVLIALFFIWGILMYKAWVWLDKHIKD